MTSGPAAPRVLILGGTGEARDLADALTEAQIPMVSSLAGRVAQPRLPVGGVRIGGFGGVDGLREWLLHNDIDAVVDATHPFAITMTRHAVQAARALDVPLLRLRRPAWSDPDGHWTHVATIDAAAAAVGPDARRVFLTTGRQDVGAFAAIDSAWFLIRVVDVPTGAVPPRCQILRSRGPYEFAGELSILREHEIDTLVTKNSGGDLTHAKLDAAAAAGVRVIMVDRPAEPEGTDTVDTIDAALTWVRTHLP